MSLSSSPPRREQRGFLWWGRLFAQAALWVGCLSLGATASAQVSMRLSLHEQQFLAGESLPVEVKITNYSGQTLHLGRSPGWLVFNIESPEQLIVPKLGEVRVPGKFDLPNSRVLTKRIDVAPYFDLTKPGRYVITATLRLRQWGKTLQGSTATFDVMSGVRLWSQAIGVPSTAGGFPKMRRYNLIQCNQLQRMKLYFRLTDVTGNLFYQTYSISSIVSFGSPEHQIDQAGRLHVLCQYGARDFNYLVITPDGRTILRHTYQYTDTRPTLAGDGKGDIAVIGGARIPTAFDITPGKNTADLPSVESAPKKSAAKKSGAPG